MNISDVQDQVAAISKIHRDGEAAHCAEDKLYRDVLQAIADRDTGGARPADLALAALQASRIKFARWYAKP